MNHRIAAATVALSVVSLLLLAQFVQLVGLVLQTESGVPGRDLLMAFTAAAGFAAVVGIAGTGRVVVAARSDAH